MASYRDILLDMNMTYIMQRNGHFRVQIPEDAQIPVARDKMIAFFTPYIVDELDYRLKSSKTDYRDLQFHIKSYVDESKEYLKQRQNELLKELGEVNAKLEVMK